MILAGPGSSLAADREAEYRVQLKKIHQYLQDHFCYDALTLAREARNREGGEKRFELREATAQAQFCLGEVLATLATLDEAEQQIDVTAEQRTRLNALRDQVKSRFGELKLRLPAGRHGRVTVDLQKTASLDDPSLESHFEQVRLQLKSGTVTVPDTRLFLPRGSYRIDAADFRIADFEGVTFKLGRERPARGRRGNLGDGQAFALGYLSLTGWQGDSLPLKQMTGGTQEVIGTERIEVSGNPFLEVSSTRVWLWGGLGYVGLRGDLQWRPPITLPGGASDSGLTPTWISAAVSLHRQQISRGGWSVELGAGLRFIHYAWLDYLAIVELNDTSGNTAPGTSDPYSGEAYNVSRMPISMPTFGGGLELTGASGWVIPAGKNSLQVGIELRAGLSSLVPVQRTGSETIETGGDPIQLDWRLYEERLWGTWVGTVLYVRAPFF